MIWPRGGGALEWGIGHRRALLTAALLLAAVALSLPVGNQAYAACAADSEAAYRERADLIASGTVENVEVRPDSSRVEVSVERVFKGESDGTLYVTTDSGSEQATSVDVRFEPGERYLLYLREEGDELKTSVCDGTREISGSSTSFPPGLGEGESPTGDESGETLPETGGIALVGAPLALVSIILAAWAWRRLS